MIRQNLRKLDTAIEEVGRELTYLKDHNADPIEIQDLYEVLAALELELGGAIDYAVEVIYE